MTKDDSYPLTPNFWIRLNAEFARRQKDPADLDGLGRNQGIDFRTWRRWKSRSKHKRPDGSHFRIQRERINRIARFLEIHPDDLVDYLTATKPVEFDELSTLAVATDTHVMRQVRLLADDATTQDIRDAYHANLRYWLNANGTIGSTLFDLLNDANTFRLIVENLEAPKLRVVVGPNFERIDFVVPNEQVLSVHNPRLLWDCRCVKVGKSQQKKDCPIHSVPIGATVHHLFFNSLIEIEWRKLRFLWRDDEHLWPPSRDSFAMLTSLSEAGALNTGAMSLLDLGAGTGFLGICFAVFSTSVKRVTFSDWLITPALYCATNWLRNQDFLRDVEYQVQCGMHGEWTAGAKGETNYDVLLCNPPYLPRLAGFNNIARNTVVAGTDLLEHVIVKGRDLAQRVFVNFSNIAFPEARAAEKRSLYRMKGIGKPTRVPFMLRKAQGNMKYWKELTQSRGVRQHSKFGHQHTHTIRTYEIVDRRG